MRRDLIIGILVSVLIHAGIAVGGEIMKHRPKKAVPKEDTPTVELMKMPDIPPDDPDPVDNEPQAEASPIAPPSLVDVPGVVQVDSFVQQIQPPPPPNMGKPTGVITIPTGRIGAGNGKGLGEIFDLKNLDQQPAAKFQAKPAYPFEMRRAGINGEVTVQFVVDSNGNVVDPFVVKSSQREFEAAAIAAVAKWKFRPGRRGGRAVATRMVVPMVFSLNNDE